MNLPEHITRTLRAQNGAVCCAAPARPAERGFAVARVPGDQLSRTDGSVFRMTECFATDVKRPTVVVPPEPGEPEPETPPPSIVTTWTPFGDITPANYATAVAKGVAAPLLSRRGRRKMLRIFLVSGSAARVFVGNKPVDFNSPGGYEMHENDEFLLSCRDINAAVWVVSDGDGSFKIVEDLA